MKRFSRKMVLSVLTLVLMVVALGATTFAWFTLGNTASVQTFEANVSSGEGLEMIYVKSNGDVKGGYVRVIQTSDMVKYLAEDYGYGAGENAWANNFKLGVVTSTDGKVFTKLSDDHTQLLTSVSGRANTAINRKDDGFIEFKLRFRTEKADADLVWKEVSIVNTYDSEDANPSGVLWTPQTAFNEIGTTPARYFAANGARISLTSSTKTVVYELPEVDNVNKVLSNNKPLWNAGAHDYFKKVTGTDLSLIYGDAPGSNYRAVETVTVLEDNVGQNDGIVMGNFGSGSGYKTLDVTIRIYLEGFDSETFDAILKDVLKVSLGFELR